MANIYVNIPFCKNRCNYCGFTVTTRYNDELLNSYVNTLLVELRQKLSEYSLMKPNEKFIKSIYFGGGTPSLLPTYLLEKLTNGILKAIQDYQFVYLDYEFTIELNPEDYVDNLDLLSFLSESKINRFSVGVQSLNNDVLAKFGRNINIKKLHNALEQIKKVCNDNNKALSVDVIYDTPYADFDEVSSWVKTLSDIYDPEHISAYTYSHDTNFLSDYEDEAGTNSDYKKMRELMMYYGYYRYEISNYAKIIDDINVAKDNGKHSLLVRQVNTNKFANLYYGIHNSGYWLMNDYIGIGANAHSMVTIKIDERIRRNNLASVVKYIENVNNSSKKYYEETAMNGLDILNETVIFGLRTQFGINLEDNVKLNITKSVYNEYYSKLLKRIESLIDDDLIVFIDNKYFLTPEGEAVFDSIETFLYL